jgi:acetylserotonin N-methyltransferase
MTTSPARILDLIEAFRRSKAMFTALELGLFERQPQTDPERRLADACVALGLLEPDGGGYRNTAEAELYLRRESAETLTGYIDYSNRVLYRLWADLAGAVREGSHRWNSTGTLFANFYDTPESMRTFRMGMHGFGRIASPAVVAAFDLSRFRRMVDLGGATGHLADAAQRRYPELRAAVLDLGPVAEFGREITPGIEFIAGDFFDGPLPEADLYALGRILHDWSEPKIRMLLSKIAAALPSGGGLLIAEALLDDDRRGPVHAHMQSLNMLVVTEGRERTFGEYRKLLLEAGFAGVEAARTGKPVDAILALKP